VPQGLGGAVERIVAARGQADRLKTQFGQSAVPMAMVDGRRRYVDANGPFRLAVRLKLSEIRGRTIGDLSRPSDRPTVDRMWERLLNTGCVAGVHEVAGPDGGRLEVAYYALANALPGLHLFASIPVGWPADELGVLDEESSDPSRSPLTSREREVLQLVADGLSGPSVAGALFISQDTVKTHLHHVYEKLGVSGRAAAVGTGMRLGLIL
jgi:DNA-binding CsgD family transcriptional regulator